MLRNKTLLVKPLIILTFIYLLVIILKYQGFMLTYQITPSMPKGLYLVIPHLIERKDIIVFTPPQSTLTFLKSKHWIPQNGLMMKYVAGLSGDTVCQSGSMLRLNGQKLVPVYKYYAPGKSLPNSKFCGVIPPNNYLLLSNKSKRSFDGRYFGPIDAKLIKGKAIALITYDK